MTPLNSTVVVAGGAGFIGGHLVRQLVAQGAHVTVIDNLHTGTTRHFEGLSKAQVTFVEADICEPRPLACDLVINLACPASPLHYQAQPLKTWRTSVLGTMHLAQAALDSGARFLQASTSEVYGDPEVHPQTEDYVGNVSFTGPRACYDEGKRAAETYLLDMLRETEMDVRIARIFNTFGPGMALNDGRAVSNFVLQALSDEPITIMGSGDQTRSFCYVSDTVRGLLKLALTEDLSGAIVNIGNPDERSISEIARTVLAQCPGSASQVSYLPEAVDDPRRRCPDISRAKALLDWQPEVALKEGLAETVSDFARRIAAKEACWL
ncbi:MAG: NAD-dependent epimerase/dehydratase family protein [Shimia sp.]|uniref:NAD-dependent epimerase/dehydratase family protein n=1 Tax=Shimia sp. TaxID=1954381 RepID=UPI004059FACC